MMTEKSNKYFGTDEAAVTIIHKIEAFTYGWNGMKSLKAILSFDTFFFLFAKMILID